MESNAFKRLKKRKNRERSGRTMLFFVSVFILLGVGFVSAECVDWNFGDFSEWCCDDSSAIPVEIIDEDNGYCCPLEFPVLSNDKAFCLSDVVDVGFGVPYVDKFLCGDNAFAFKTLGRDYPVCVASMDSVCGYDVDCFEGFYCDYGEDYLCKSFSQDSSLGVSLSFWDRFWNLVRSWFEGFGRGSLSSPSVSGGSANG